MIYRVLVLGALALAGFCACDPDEGVGATEENDGRGTPGAVDDGTSNVQGSPPASSTDLWYQRLDGGTEDSSLGFSGADAADAFEGDYVSTLKYTTGGQSQLSIRVTPTGAPLDAFDDGTDYAVQTVPARMGTISRGIKEGPAVVLSVDVTVHSEDGKLDETFAATLRAFDLGFARFEKVVSLSASDGAYELQGTFQYDPEDFPGGTIGLFVDLYREPGSFASSGWLGGVGEIDGVQVWKRPINELAVWGECRFPTADAGHPICDDAGSH